MALDDRMSEEGEKTGTDASSPGQESEDQGDREFYGYIPQSAPAGNRRAPLHLWLISYSDFMTILMIFFLVMYGTTYMAKATMRRQQGSPIPPSDFARFLNHLRGDFGPDIQILDQADKIVLKLKENILFSSGEATLTSPAKRALAGLANSVKLVKGDIIVEGHTDNVPVVGGRYRSNWELSAARSFSVIEALIQQGVAPNRLAAWGFGENRPRAPNDSEKNRAQNRRIEIILMKKGKGG